MSETLATTALLRAQAGASQGDWDACRAALADASQALRSVEPQTRGATHADLCRRHDVLRRRANPVWWTPLGGGGISLRRTQAEDEAFYRACHADAGFVRRFNRQPPWTGDLSKALQSAGRASPLDLGAVHWVVCREGAGPIGLASLTSLNLPHARAEVALGFPGHASPMAAIKAMLLIYDFAFLRAGFNKLWSQVYRDNDEALHNSLRAGLRQEGLLREHLYLPPGEFVDVYLMGLTRRELLSDARLVSMARRRLGLQWPAPDALRVERPAPTPAA